MSMTKDVLAIKREFTKIADGFDILVANRLIQQKETTRACAFMKSCIVSAEHRAEKIAAYDAT